jgi:hypothetical protein
MSTRCRTPHPADEFAAALVLVAKKLTSRAATDPNISEDGVQRAVEELWAGPRACYLDARTGHIDVEHVQRAATLRARSRTIDEWRRHRTVSLDAPMAAGSGETLGSQTAAPDDRLDHKLDAAAMAAEIARRSSQAGGVVATGIMAIVCRLAGYSDEEVAAARGGTREAVRKSVSRTRAWARDLDLSGGLARDAAQPRAG